MSHLKYRGLTYGPGEEELAADVTKNLRPSFSGRLAIVSACLAPYDAEENPLGGSLTQEQAIELLAAHDWSGS